MSKKQDALEPYMSQRTLEVHWGGHHRNYVEGLNKQLEKSDVLYGYTFDELVKATYNNGNPLPEFYNAAQVNTHLTPRPILLTRHGESKDNVRGRIGGDNPLSDTGEIYAKKLANFVEKRLKSEQAASVSFSNI
ncbi:superoxide dismutase [Fe] 3, chloroplastic-like [Pyrus communis]|uniref:superoxide dismutase [Fe] 3, chloroplastic-like n=1 Tax=Pyrus communis TaxID=23211 RepID=UPI0035BF6F2E